MTKKEQKTTEIKYFPDAKVTCACGNTFTAGSTVPEIKVEICSNCHPFYTGKQKLVDSARRVEKFKERAAKQESTSAVRKGKKVKKARLKQIKSEKEKKVKASDK